MLEATFASHLIDSLEGGISLILAGCAAPPPMGGFACVFLAKQPTANMKYLVTGLGFILSVICNGVQQGAIVSCSIN